MTVAGSCAELAVLAPMLGPALTRDNTATGRFTRLEVTLSPVNTDVLSAMITLRHEIPAAAMRCCQLVAEPWQQRTLAACLTALPRLDARMRHLTLMTESRQLGDACRHWVRITKRALGLRTPDIALGVACPACEDEPGELYAAGSEGFLRRTRDGITVEWVHEARICCAVCRAAWTQPEWEHLGLIAHPYATRQQVSA